MDLPRRPAIFPSLLERVSERLEVFRPVTYTMMARQYSVRRSASSLDFCVGLSSVPWDDVCVA